MTLFCLLDYKAINQLLPHPVNYNTEWEKNSSKKPAKSRLGDRSKTPMIKHLPSSLWHLNLSVEQFRETIDYLLKAPSFCDINYRYDKQLSYRRETALQGGLDMAKSGRLELWDNIYGQYKSIFNCCDVFGQQSNQIRWKMQNKGHYVVQGHRGWCQLKARMWLPLSD